MASNKELTTKSKQLDSNAAKDDKPDTIVKSNETTTEAPKPDHTVAEGKSLTSKRGILTGGEGIAADDLAGGADAFAALGKAGYIVKS